MPREPYPFQLRLRDYNSQYLGPPKALPPCSYFGAEEHVVFMGMLKELEGEFGDHLMLRNESVAKLESVLKGKQVR